MFFVLFFLLFLCLNFALDLYMYGIYSTRHAALATLVATKKRKTFYLIVQTTLDLVVHGKPSVPLLLGMCTVAVSIFYYLAPRFLVSKNKFFLDLRPTSTHTHERLHLLIYFHAPPASEIMLPKPLCVGL